MFSSVTHVSVNVCEKAFQPSLTTAESQEKASLNAFFPDQKPPLNV